jgi:hypothetical protein
MNDGPALSGQPLLEQTGRRSALEVPVGVIKRGQSRAKGRYG